MHVLFRLSRVQPIAQIEQELKRGSSNWLRSRGLNAFGWQNGYSAFSVSPDNLQKATRYIENQENLHRSLSLASELSNLIRKTDGLEYRVEIHLVFSTKNRTYFLIDDDVRKLLHTRISEICEDLGCPARQVGGVEDHVHILYQLSEQLTLARVAQEIKKATSSWLGYRHRIMHFDWQEGYGAFSVSPQHVPAVIHYIKNQREHHRHDSEMMPCPPNPPNPPRVR